MRHMKLPSSGTERTKIRIYLGRIQMLLMTKKKVPIISIHQTVQEKVRILEIRFKPR